MFRLKKIIHFIFMTLPAILSVLMIRYAGFSIILFNKIELNKWFMLAFPITYVLAILYFNFWAGAQTELLELNEMYRDIARFKIQRTLIYSVVELLFMELTLTLLELVGSSVAHWSSIAGFYANAILILYGTCFISALFSILAIDKYVIPHVDLETKEVRYLDPEYQEQTKKSLSKIFFTTGVINMLVCSLNLGLCIWISNLSVFKYCHVINLVAFLFEVIYMARQYKRMWPDREISEKEKEEMIL